MDKCEKVFWENETTYKDDVNNNNKPYGLYYYLDENIVSVEWFDSESKRDSEYNKYKSEGKNYG